MIRPRDIRRRYGSAFFDQSIAVNIFLLFAVTFLMLPIASYAGGNTHAGGVLISLTAKDEPLGNVLNKISIATGYEFVLDHDWRNYLVSVALEKVPLDKGLKRILKDLNNVIVYVSSNKIKIIIYDKVSTETGSSVPSIQRAPISRQPSYRPPKPDVPDSGVLGRDITPSDNPAVTGEESETEASEDDESKNKTLENIKTKTDKGTRTNLEDNSSGHRSQQNDQNGSTPDEETERPQDDENNINNQ